MRGAPGRGRLGRIEGFEDFLDLPGAKLTQFFGQVPLPQHELDEVPVGTLAQTPGNEWPAARMMILSLVLAIAALVVSEVSSRRIARRLGVGS